MKAPPQSPATAGEISPIVESVSRHTLTRSLRRRVAYTEVAAQRYFTLALAGVAVTWLYVTFSWLTAIFFTVALVVAVLFTALTASRLGDIVEELLRKQHPGIAQQVYQQMHLLRPRQRTLKNLILLLTRIPQPPR